MKNHCLTMLIGFYVLIGLITGSCSDNNPLASYPQIDRIDKLPADISKRTPETDHHPPILHSDDYEDPIPLGPGVNTSGAEDSPFILPDGNTLYFFFTPDVRVPPEQQLFDQVSGVWVSQKINNEWQPAERVWLQKAGKLSLDGAVAIQEDEMWFASAREGYTGVNMFTAELINDQWINWCYSGDRLMNEIQIGEVHLWGNDLYFHSDRAGGFGAYDLWVTTRSAGSWSDPVNLKIVNSPEDEGLPFITQDGNELWFTRTYQGTPAIFRSYREGNDWGVPELIISQFAGEPTLDSSGNIYFVHHFYENEQMIEADIYVAYRK